MSKQMRAFLLNTRLDNDWDVMEAKFGLKGFAITVKLLQRIYGVEGYYCEFDSDARLVFAKSVGVRASFVSELVDFWLARGLFDSEKLDKLGILTSATIQLNFLNTFKRSKEVYLESSFICDLNAISAYENAKIVYRNLKNDDNFKRIEEKLRVSSNSSNSEQEHQHEFTKEKKESVFDVIEGEFQRPLSPMECQEILEFQKNHSDELIIFAVKTAVLQQKRSISYIRGILTNWYGNNVRSVPEAEALVSNFKAKKESSSKTQKKNYGTQRKAPLPKDFDENFKQTESAEKLDPAEIDNLKKKLKELEL